MHEGFYISIGKEKSVATYMDVVSNNIANLDTPAYKSQDVQFKEVLNRNNEKESFTYELYTFSNHEIGNIKKTYNTLDIALSKRDVYFAVNTDNGIRYTRNGSFKVNENNILQTKSGFNVVSENGDDIIIPKTDEQVLFSDKGEIFNGSNQIGKIGIFSSHEELTPIGNNLYIANGELEADTGDTEVLQGYLELSNVSSIYETQKMIQISREFEAATKLVNQISGNMQNIINKIIQSN